jgi:hypothetical protein
MTVTFVGRSPVSLAVAGTASVAVGFGFARYGFGLFVPVFRMEFGLDTQTIGAIGSGSYAVYLVSLLGCGVLSARWGPRLPVVTGTTFAFIGLTLVSLASTAEMLVVGILMAAASSGWVWAPFADAVARRVSPSQRARVLAVIGTGTTFGLIVAGSLAPLGSDRPTAWRPVWAGFALAAALATAASVLAIPGRRDGKKKRTRTRFRLTRKAFPLIGHGMLCCSVVIAAMAASRCWRYQRCRDRRGGPRRRAATNARNLRRSSCRINRRSCGLSVEPVNRIRRRNRFRLRFHADRGGVGLVEPGSSPRTSDERTHACPVQSRCGVDGRAACRWGGCEFVRFEGGVFCTCRTHLVGHRATARWPSEGRGRYR